MFTTPCRRPQKYNRQPFPLAWRQCIGVVVVFCPSQAQRRKRGNMPVDVPNVSYVSGRQQLVNVKPDRMPANKTVKPLARAVKLFQTAQATKFDNLLQNFIGQCQKHRT